MLVAERVDLLEGSSGSERSDGMYARVTTIQGTPGKMDDAKGHIQEQTLPNSRRWTASRGS